MAMTGQYTIYHLHSDLSNGVTNVDSVTKYGEYIELAKNLGDEGPWPSQSMVPFLSGGTKRPLLKRLE